MRGLKELTRFRGILEDLNKRRAVTSKKKIRVKN